MGVCRSTDCAAQDCVLKSKTSMELHYEQRERELQGHGFPPDYVKSLHNLPMIDYNERPAAERERVMNAVVDPTSKPTNPKDAIGSNKVPLHLWPETATVLGALGLLDGALKYGRSNYRAIGVRASIYYDAARRHLNAWFEGEDTDPDSGLPQLAHVLACVAIIIDAEAAGKLNDDRNIAGGYRQLIDSLTPHVARLKEQYTDKKPHHYTITDNTGGTP
jgi:hypothetical protein